MLRVAFAGTPDFAATILAAILASEHEVGLVVSQPDRRRGRGRKLDATPVAELARERELSLVQPENISEVNDRIATHDALVVAAYGQILCANTLDAARLGAWNVHASLLPKYRGAAPIERAIMDGDTRSGVSIMKMDEGLDTGPVAKTGETDIPSDMTGGELTVRLAVIGGEAIVEVLSELEAGSTTLAEQDSLEATYASKVLREDQKLDWERGVWEVHNVVRALAPHIGARCYVVGDEQPLKLWKTWPEASTGQRSEPGRIYVQNGRIFVGCGDGRVEILELQAAGGRRMSSEEFLRGNDVSGTLLV
ncbi:MAG: methionyl-tRNA formyltransferase [Rubrobacter sp.]